MFTKTLPEQSGQPRSIYKNKKREIVTKKIHFFYTNIHAKRILLVTIALLTLFNLTSCAQKATNGALSLNKKIGQMLNIGFRGLDAPDASTITKNIEKNHIGSVMLFDYDVPADSALRNIQSPTQVQHLTSQLQQHADIPLFIAIDQEGGRVSRLKEKFGFPPTVSAQYLGEINNLDSTRYYARRTAKTLQKAGINVNLAPVVDLNLNPHNPVIGGLERSFSAKAPVVIRHARAYIEEMHSQDILTTLKHFPGHGSSKEDSHKGIVDVTQTWQKEELKPYQNLIESGHADIIMTAHIYNAKLDSTYPATLSKPIISGILRDSLNFDGVVMSDDLQMGAIRKHYTLKETIKLAIQAGVDILSFANNSVYDPKIADKAHRIIEELIDEGEITEERIDESYQRIMELKKRL